MFSPKYNLSTLLLENILKIKNIVIELNNSQFSDLVLAKFEKDSYAISAFASTSIEGNPLPLTEVRKLLKNKPEQIRDTEREVLNYNKALILLGEKLKKKVSLSAEFICEIQRVVVDGLLDKKNIGKFRLDPVVVNDPKLRKIIYIPPDAKEVKVKMKELVEFISEQKKSLDPLILAGIFHKQFVIIHPFIDGNGRSTRLLTKYLLANMGLDTFKLFSFENYYNQNVTNYFKNVGELGDYYDLENKIDFTKWLEYFTGGIIDELLRVQKMLFQEKLPELEKDFEKDILNYLQTHEYINEKTYKVITKRKRSTRISDFKYLVDKGILQRNNQGKAVFYTLVKS